MKFIERAHPLNRAASDAALSGEPSRGETVLAWLLLAPVILPVILWSGLIYPYLVPKTLLFYAISFVTIGAFAVLVAYSRPFFWNRLKRGETWIPGALLALAYVASFYGIDFYRSFWSLFIRGDGLLMLTCSVASFYLIVLHADRKFFELLLRASASVASFVAAYGIGEWLMNGGRIGGLLGNAAFFAGYLGITFFVTLLAAQSLPRGWKYAAYAGAALQVIAIILSATRGTILALGLAFVLFLTVVAFSRPEQPESKNGVRLGLAARSDQFFLPVPGLRKMEVPSWCAPFFGFGRDGRLWAIIMLAALVIIGGAFVAFRSELAKVPFEPIARIASISTTEGDVASRLFIWKNMVTEIKQAPLLGVGAEHIDALFNRFYDPTQISEEWFDRSHNAFFDYTVQYGIGGLLLYLALIVAFFTTAARFARHTSPSVTGFARRDKRVALLFSLLAVTYAVQNFFVFDTISSFWLLLALLGAFLAITAEDSPREALPVGAGARPFAWVGAAVLVGLIVPVSIRPALAAYDLAAAYTYQIADVPKEVSYLSHGIALGTYGDVEYGYEAYDMYTNTQMTVLSGQSRVDAYNAALSILTTDFNRYPYDARTALYLAHVLTLAPAGVTADQALLSSALERSIRLSPKRAQPWYILVNLSISSANAYPAGSKERADGYAAARDLLARYIALVPTLSEPHFVLAELLHASGDAAASAKEAAKGKEYYTSDLKTAQRAAGYYEGQLDLPNAEYFLKEIIRLDPTSTAAASDLAKIQAYEQSGK